MFVDKDLDLKFKAIYDWRRSKMHQHLCPNSMSQLQQD